MKASERDEELRRIRRDVWYMALRATTSEDKAALKKLQSALTRWLQRYGAHDE